MVLHVCFGISLDITGLVVEGMGKHWPGRALQKGHFRSMDRFVVVVKYHWTLWQLNGLAPIPNNHCMCQV